MNKIKVLIVDDSLVSREVIARGISADPMIEVVAKAIDPIDAWAKILQFHPDVVTCDVEMPKMDGIKFIQWLLPKHPVPVIVVSSVSKSVFDAMNAGAVDFVSKPEVQSPINVEKFILELIAKVKIAARANINRIKIEQISRPVTEGFDYRKVIAIGSSTGGTEALYHLLKSLPNTVPGIVIVQHIPPMFSRMLAERLNNQTALKVKEAQNGDYVEQGKVIIAPGDHHMKVKKIGDKYKIEIYQGEKVNGHCPSVDVLFESVAKEVGNDAVGIILTGMGYDGAKGLLSLRRKGARTIGQDEESCVVYGMPKVAFELGAVEKQASLSNIPKILLSMLK